MVLTLEREKRGWSKSELARRADLCNPTIGQIESGRFAPYDVQLVKIARALSWPEDHAHDLLQEVGQDGGDAA